MVRQVWDPRLSGGTKREGLWVWLKEENLKSCSFGEHVSIYNLIAAFGSLPVIVIGEGFEEKSSIVAQAALYDVLFKIAKSHQSHQTQKSLGQAARPSHQLSPARRETELTRSQLSLPSLRPHPIGYPWTHPKHDHPKQRLKTPWWRRCRRLNIEVSSWTVAVQKDLASAKRRSISWGTWLKQGAIIGFT